VEVTFTKTGPRSYDVVARRDDGVVLRVPSPDRPASLPHDIAHYLVERELNFERGFWGCVAAGAVFDNMQVISGRRPPHAAERSKAVVKAAGRQLTASEIYVVVMLGITREGKEGDWAGACASLDEVWRPFRWPRPPVSAEELLRVCLALRETEQQWAALPAGRGITFSWGAPGRKGRRRARAARDSR
jgi:hypothetical protein